MRDYQSKLNVIDRWLEKAVVAAGGHRPSRLRRLPEKTANAPNYASPGSPWSIFDAQLSCLVSGQWDGCALKANRRRFLPDWVQIVARTLFGTESATVSTIAAETDGFRKNPDLHQPVFHLSLNVCLQCNES
jgi:hypothetical protein